ncbi:replication-relaxation family protein [Streptomyces broussonetiae]|uniref:Replication-relaxation family protein n=1 Tax=Streptomyces broussonetiae TaxID=2686304 RepID=A0ABV5EJW1_9ACTN
METINRLRLATGVQLERLHFHELNGKSRSVMRWRVLKRLVDWKVIAPLARRIGGSLRGSAQLVYALDVVGERLLRLRRNLRKDQARIRRAAVPSERFVRHTLAVSELYVSLSEASCANGFHLDEFQSEPASWWPNGLGGWMKPDAYTALSLQSFTDHWWIEVDLATEAAPTLRGKFLSYLDFVNQGQLGPADVVPRVLVTVPNEYRQDVMERIVRSLPDPAEQLFSITLHEAATTALTAALYESDDAGATA